MTAHQKANKQNLQVGDLVKSNFQAAVSGSLQHHKHFDSERKLGIVLEIAEEVKHNEHLGPYIECKVEWLSGPHRAPQVMADFFLLKV